ncbi:MAG: hypothetical protein ACXVBX_04000 [Flavisolibacter sp.]
MKRLPAFILAMVCLSCGAQTKEKTGVFYFALGSHVAGYTNSDIHLKSTAQPSFDFVLEQVKGTDDKFLASTGGAMQYDYQFGYYFKKKNFGIEYNFDHVKYFAKHDQTVRTVGTVNGQKVDEVLPITTYVQNFEHSNGGNYFLLNFVKWKDLVASKDRKRILDLMYKAGAGIVMPKTNSTIMNNHKDDTYNVAGYVIALEGGIRYNFLKNMFIESSVKGAFANYSHILIYNGTGRQHWFSGQFLLMAGFQF